MSSNILLDSLKTIESECIPKKFDEEFHVTKSSDRLKPEVEPTLFNHRTCFEYIREIAIARLEKTIDNQLELLTLGDKYDYSHIEELSNHIFKWSKSDFLKRRELKNLIWIDVLQIESEKELLEKLKILTDLKEIKELIKIIFDVLTNRKKMDGNELEISVWQPMREVEKYLNIFEILHDENEELTKIHKELEYRVNERLYNKRQTQQQILFWDIEKTLLNSQVWDPIQMRYEINWCLGKTAQAELKNSLIENNIQSSIEKYKFNIELENMCGANIRDIYYSLAEQHKNQINVLQNRYDMEVEDLDNKMNFTRLQIKKLQDQRNFLTEQIGRFHEEIKERLAKEERERQKQEEERLRLEQEALLESQKRTNRPKRRSEKGKKVGRKSKLKK